MSTPNKIDEGGNAFPSSVPVANDGMFLRDWFAGQALSSLNWKDYGDSFSGIQRAAGICFEMADAMIAERSKTNEPNS